VPGFPGFPEWLGKNSTKNKKKRLLSELTMHLADKVGGDQGRSVAVVILVAG
jgi:hypothetical protein